MRKERATVISQAQIAPDIYDMWLQTELAGEAAAGQFVGVYPNDASALLPRPISICEVNEKKDALRLVYRVAGKGTKEFSGLQAEDQIALLGVLGNGFPVAAAKDRKVALMGGGIGIPPLLQLAAEMKRAGLAREIHIIAGYRDKELFLQEDLERYGMLHIATEDGSVGTRGTVLQVLEQEECFGHNRPDLIMACGPMPMLRAVKQYAIKQEIPAYISLEERMACGVGACLGCVCRTTTRNHHSQVNNARICTDGPVFEAREVDI